MPRWNGKILVPFVVVPSGKFTTGTPARRAASALRSARIRLCIESRSTKITPTLLAAEPMIGQLATSLFAIGAHGSMAAMAIGSR